MKVEAVKWLTHGVNVIGFVRGRDETTGAVKIYAGTGYGVDEDADTQRILADGSKVDAADMAAFFMPECEQIEAMKCCGNCEVFDKNEHMATAAPCSDCKRTSTWRGQKPTEDHWTLAT